MRMSPNLPIEEQKRLRQEYMEMSNRPLAAFHDRANNRTGLDSMFNDLGQPNISNHAMTLRQEYEQARREAAKYRKERGDMGRYVMDSPTRTERSFEDWMKSRKDRPTLWRNPVPLGGPNIDDTYPTGNESYLPFPKDEVTIMPQPGTIMPQPGTVMPSPEVMPSPGKPQPIDMPRPPVMLPLPGQENPYPVGPIRPGGMPRPGRGRGFLNRFERLLDGLEGLVGKLGGESPKDTGPLVDPVGGVGSLTPTPFTASQDY